MAPTLKTFQLETELTSSVNTMLFGSLPATETSVSKLLPGLISLLLYSLIEFHPRKENI